MRFIIKLVILVLSTVFFTGCSVLHGQKKKSVETEPAKTITEVQPVTPNASPEAIALLKYIYSISGEKTLSGQHCVPLMGSLRLPTVEKQIGVYPAVFGQDFGFSPPGTWDGINYRQQIVDEAIRRHEEGFIITLMWHAVRPIDQEPVPFRPARGDTSDAAVQSELTDKQWQDMITPGTEINERWKSQVDVIAWHLMQLRNAGVPVLWRPYHEMNGGWFWWGNKKGEGGYKKLWQMMFKRLVNFHKLNNLLWVFNGNEVKFGVADYEHFYPGDEYVDILATDVYTQGFDSLNYAKLTALAGTKPIGLGEVGAPPSEEILERQPRWTWFMRWGDNSGSSWEERRKRRQVWHAERVLNWSELPWVDVDKPKIHYPVLK